MAKILFLVTQTPDDFAKRAFEAQRESANDSIEQIDLTEADVDYKEVLEKIFAADSVQVW